MRRWANRTTTTFLILVGLLFLVTALIVSPVALRALATVVPRSEWTVLSDIGQAYGPAAMLLTALSLIAVAYTALLQLRGTRIMSQETWRTQHFELLRIAMDSPALAQVAGDRWDGPEDDFLIRLSIYANAWANHWRAMYTLGLMDDDQVRDSARRHFQGEASRRHWANFGDSYRVGSHGQREQRFCRIMDEELAKTSSSKALPVVIPKSAAAQTRTLAAFSAGVALALGVVTILRRQRL